MRLVKFERAFLAILDSIAQTLVRPFSNALSLDAFYDRGYIALGIFTSVVVGLAWAFGYLRQPISEASPAIQLVYQWTVARLPLWPARDVATSSLLLLPLALYLVGAGLATARRYLGRVFIDFAGWLIGASIAFGEWCLEHPWQSVVIIALLVSIVVVGVDKQIDTATERDKVARAFDYWLDDTETFVNENAMSRVETERYLRSGRLWNNDFVDYLGERTSHHPAKCLHTVLDKLYADASPDKLWSEVLRQRLDLIERSAQECDSSHAAEHDLASDRAFILVHLLMGRVYARVGEMDQEVSYLKSALGEFKVAETEARTHLNDKTQSHYLISALNGEGTIYASALTVYLRAPAVQGAMADKDLRAICSGSHDCAVRSLSAYDAARSAPKCSFAWRRNVNNSADLLSRIGTNFTVVSTSGVPPGDTPWWNSRGDLAEELDREIHDLISCSGSEPLVPATFVTAAQAFGVAAQLHHDTGAEWQQEAEASGTYLKLASTFDPQNVSGWDLSYICPLYRLPDGKKLIDDSLQLRKDGFGKSLELSRQIGRQCL